MVEAATHMAVDMFTTGHAGATTITMHISGMEQITKVTVAQGTSNGGTDRAAVKRVVRQPGSKNRIV